MITCLGYQDFPNHAISDTSKGLDKVREDKIWAYEFQYPYITATLGSATIIDIVDFNLNRVASIQGIKVLNINELANALKPVVFPGEEMHLKLIKEGKEHNQAIGYLDDGTMVVVEDARRLIGQDVKVVVTSVLQTQAGRMIFTKVEK